MNVNKKSQLLFFISQLNDKRIPLLLTTRRSQKGSPGDIEDRTQKRFRQENKGVSP
jgi:hypothetical protein